MSNNHMKTLLIAVAFASAQALDSFDIESYMGHWYQMYADNYVAKTFERGGYCVTADYRLNEDNTVSLFNSQSNGNAEGPLSNVTGTGYTTNTAGHLTIKFTPGDASPFPAPYWILSLGPISNGLYEYAIVSDQLNASLFVLARDPETFDAMYDSEVQTYLTENGFNGFINTPVATYQSASLCNYAESPVYVDASKKSSGCPNVSPLSDVDLDEYTRATWYIQQQQVTKYQTEEDLYCVLATYDKEQEIETLSVPFFNGPVVGVYNYENVGSVNGHAQGNGSHLCARETNTSNTGSLLVAPCFLPNIAAGPYWVIAIGYEEGSDTTMSWSIVSGGQPTVAYDDGCTTSLDKTNNSGLWIFSRTQVMDPEDLATARQLLVDMGYTLSQLIDVPQDGCQYQNAVIKN